MFARIDYYSVYPSFIDSFRLPTSGVGTDYPSRAHEVTPVFSGFRVTRSLALCVSFVDCCMSFCTFLLVNLLSVLLRYTDSDYPVGIFKLFLVSSNSS